MNISERLGYLFGYPLGVIVAIVSFVRASRMFHPCGTVVKISIYSHDVIHFPEEGIMRFSSAWWKHKQWLDVLGVSIRFGDKQDLLFASFKHPWQTPVGPFLTKYKSYFQNSYFVVSPFSFKHERVIFRLTPYKFESCKGSREEELQKNIMEKAVWKLWIKKDKDPWLACADIQLEQELQVDQKKLRFNPFLNGLEIYPKGFIHHLRIGVYQLGQFGRTLR
jgi:hypothetical protein